MRMRGTKGTEEAKGVLRSRASRTAHLFGFLGVEQAPAVARLGGRFSRGKGCLEQDRVFSARKGQGEYPDSLARSRGSLRR